MSALLCTKLHLLLNKTNTVLDSRTQLGHFHFHSFTVSYLKLKPSCGLSLQTAKSLSNEIDFETPEKPNPLLNLLKNHGFTNTHISKIVKQHPKLLLANVQNNILPKLQFFTSVGISSADIVTIISSSPSLLTKSLERNIIPCYHFLKTILVVDEKVLRTFKFSRWASTYPSKNLSPNIALLRELGVPQSSISLLLTNFPGVAFRKTSHFNEIVKEVKQMGLDPLKSAFVLAIAVLGQTSKANMESKYEVYERWGWSRDDTLSAFKKQPHCMLLSKKKITRVMNFFVNKMGWPTQIIAKHPWILLYSFKKRIVPRCSVVHVLLLNGLIEREFSITTLLQRNEKYFLNKFVTKYQESVPQLLDLYKGKVDLLVLGINPIVKDDLSLAIVANCGELLPGDQISGGTRIGACLSGKVDIKKE